MTAASVLDDKTASAIREALAAASFGRLADACAIGERALREGGDAAALQAMLGMLKTRMGDLDAAVGHLTMAHAQRPADVLIANNLATALARLERHRDALNVVSDELAQADQSLQLLRLRGYLAQSLGEFEAAVEAYERVVASAPNDWESWNNLGNARRGLDDHEGSLEAARRAVELNSNSAPVRLNYATALEYAGHAQEAEREYRSIAADFPEDPNSMRELFAMLRNQDRDEDAQEAIEEAVRRAPNDVELALARAGHLLAQRRHAAAEDAYRHVLTFDRSNGSAWLGIATVMDQVNRLEELAALVGQAKGANIDIENLSFIKAFDHRRAKRYREGLEALSHVPDYLETGRRQQLLGQLLDGAADYDAAFAAFERMNAIIREDRSDPATRARAYRDLVREARNSITPEWASSWREVQVDDRPSPAFLVGFPRSGTTLLDTILMAHAATEVLEEEPALVHATQAIGGIDGLPGASEETVRKARDAYFETARSLTPLDPGKLLIDKNPLSMNYVPFIRRLFPDARIILALRHPCDVLLSCYTTNFQPNNAMANFLWLDTSAELYDLSFSHFEKARELLNPAVHTVVYENIVADRDSELRPLIDFLGLEWDERVLDHQSAAKGRAHIKTASYAQVIEPIYTRSAGRWQHYRKYLEPILPVLGPWVAKFGYAM
jgi:tetratricopeptide (TPR) repeat protein